MGLALRNLYPELRNTQLAGATLRSVTGVYGTLRKSTPSSPSTGMAS
ncbi:hypothetical protein ATI61_12326 [Archangium gephyra]|uniref:Uncharacterized protein n=1 Tax=Archangium gephyra TaxID=48 RepID=A0ABX9JKY5_9BACT|nr:hypothetical protein [Archangium gephyra]REG19076.1 hypothetical protein ATI61_12326 [Archangium gephyra]